jgi:hypothetical protein
MLDLVSLTPRYELLLDRGGAGPVDLRISGPLGLDGYFRTDEQAIDQPRAAKGRWLDETSFQMVSQSLPEGLVTTSTLSFHGVQVDVDFKDNRGIRAHLLGESEN